MVTDLSKTCLLDATALDMKSLEGLACVNVGAALFLLQIV